MANENDTNGSSDPKSTDPKGGGPKSGGPKKPSPPAKRTGTAKSAAATSRRRYEGLSVATFQHPADRAATAALSAIPGLDTVVRWLIEQGYERAMYQQNLAASVRLGETQLPAIWHSFTDVLDTLDLENKDEKRPALYVSQDPTLNAMTIGSQNPYLVLTSRLVEVLQPDELQAVLGHETGHIMAGHSMYHTAMQILLSLTLPVLSPGALPLTAVRLALLEWFRAAELTCDRAAVLAVDSPELVCGTMMVLGSGLPSAQLSFDAFMQQVREYQEWDDGPDRLRRFLALLSQTHGSPVRRSAEIMQWVDSGEFERIRSGDYIRRGEEPSTLSASGDAVSHYTDRFRDIVVSASDTVVKTGSKLATWLRGTD
jgi:Zn-dependent protease with chaperone function